MKKFIYLLLFGILALGFNSCEEDEFTSNLNYVSFETSAYAFGVDVGGTNSNDIAVYTTQTSGSARTYNIVIDSAATSMDFSGITLPASVTVPANAKTGTFSVTLADVNIDPDDGETLTLKLVPADATSTGSSITLNIYQVCQQNEVIFKIDFDSYPDESYWELKTSSGTLLYGTVAGDYTGDSDYRKAFCLANGTYTFTMYDAYGDGSGPYFLEYNGTKLIDSDGGFGASESTTFTVNK